MDHDSATEQQIAAILNEVNKKVRQGGFEESKEDLNRALSIDFDNEDVISALKSVNFWVDRKRKVFQIDDDQEKGNYLFNQWIGYTVFISGEELNFARIAYPVKQWVFRTALTFFQTRLEKVGRHDPDLLCSLGRSFRAIGDYEHAVEYFESAYHQRMNDPEILAELADAYALINEVKASKVFFREAFFIDPGKIDLTFLESMLINRLIAEVKDAGYEDDLLKEWIPVYGNLYNVFNIKRELKPLEFGKLKQAVYDLEKQYETETELQEYYKPKLINHYFWLIDHYVATKTERKKIDEITDKIRSLDSEI